MLDTDDDDFSLTPSSKLSSIFSPQPISDNSNASLTYKAPKQPRPAVPEAKNVNKTNNNQSSVIFAKVATLWKNNESMGKYMAAIIGDGNGQSELIVYKEKTNILIREALGVTLTVYKSGNFLAFYDKHKHYWNLSFDTCDNKALFLEYLTKYQCFLVEQEHNNNTSQEQEKSHKQEILSRIIKTGQSILPKILSDSETESSISDTQPNKPVTAPRRKRYSCDKTIVPLSAENQFNPINPQNIIYSHSQTMHDYSLSNLILAQNAELKANLSEINLKLSQMSAGNNNNHSNNDDLDSLHSKLKVKNLKIDNLNRELEKSKKAYQELQEKCLKEEFQKKEALKMEVETLQNKVQELNGLLEQRNGELTDKRQLIKMQAEKLQDYDQNITQIEKMTRDNAEIKLELEELRNKQMESEIPLEKNRTEEIIKENMNEAFRNIMANFEENATYSVREIKKVMLDNLKKTTFNLVDSLS